MIIFLWRSRSPQNYLKTFVGQSWCMLAHYLLFSITVICCLGMIYFDLVLRNFLPRISAQLLKQLSFHSPPFFACLSVHLSVDMSCKGNSYLTDRSILMKLYTLAVTLYGPRMCIKEDNHVRNFFKGDNQQCSVGGASFCDLTDSSSNNMHVTIDDFKSVGGHNKKDMVTMIIAYTLNKQSLSRYIVDEIAVQL